MGELTVTEYCLDGYVPHVKLEPEELAELGNAVRTHGLVLECWIGLFMPDRLDGIVKNFKKERRAAENAATVVAELVRS